MIDTVKFLIPITDIKFLDKIKTKLIRTRRENMHTGELKFVFYTGEVTVGSYSRNVTMYLSESNPVGLFVEFSLPKQYYNNNIEMIQPFDVTLVLENFRNELCKNLDEILPVLSEWVIYRLDICYNWTFESEEKCQSFADFIQRIDFPRKKKLTYDTSLMFKGSGYSIKFYLKGKEFKKHDFKDLKKLDVKNANELQDWANRILRFEVEFKRVYLCNLLKKKKVFMVDIADNTLIEKLLKDYLALVFRYIDKENMKHEDARQIIYENFKPAKAYTLYNFYKNYYYNKDEKHLLLRGMSKTTIWRYKKLLKAVGVSFTENLNDKEFLALNELVIPSERGKYTLLDYKSSTYYS